MTTSTSIAPTVVLLAASNVFMTIAWYGQPKRLGQQPWYWAALFSWGIALFEYLLQVPANRKRPWRWPVVGPAEDHPGGGHIVGFRAVCRAVHAAAAEMGLPMGHTVLVRAVYFIFRS
jgi:hypothetical protein